MSFQAGCHRGGPADVVATFPKSAPFTGIDFEWPGLLAADNVEGGAMLFYNAGSGPPFAPATPLGSTAPTIEMEDISLCAFRAKFGGDGNDMCPLP